MRDETRTYVDGLNAAKLSRSDVDRVIEILLEEYPDETNMPKSAAGRHVTAIHFVKLVQQGIQGFLFGIDQPALFQANHFPP